MRKALLAIGMAIALAAAVAGCGGGDDDTGDSSSAALTKAEFIKEADKICKDHSDASEGEAEEYAEENGFELEEASEEQIEDAISAVLIPSLNEQAEEISALGAPEGEEETVEAIIDAIESGSDEIESDPQILIEGKESPLEEASKLAREYGLEECGEE